MNKTDSALKKVVPWLEHKAQHSREQRGFGKLALESTLLHQEILGKAGKGQATGKALGQKVDQSKNTDVIHIFHFFSTFRRSWPSAKCIRGTSVN